MLPPPHAVMPNTSKSSASTKASTSVRRRVFAQMISIAPSSNTVMNCTQIGESKGDRFISFIGILAVRAVVVMDIDAIPFASGMEDGLTLQLVAAAGIEQERFTVPEKPKNGVTPMSLMYDATCPATTVCVVIPRFATLKSAVKFNATGVEVEAA